MVIILPFNHTFQGQAWFLTESKVFKQFLKGLKLILFYASDSATYPESFLVLSTSGGSYFRWEGYQDYNLTSSAIKQLPFQLCSHFTMDSAHEADEAIFASIKQSELIFRIPPIQVKLSFE